MDLRHAWILGWAKLFTAKLSEGKRKLEDEDCISAVSLVWNLAVALLLKDVIDDIKQAFDYNYLHLASQLIPQGRLLQSLNVTLLDTLRPRISCPD
jgi:hypothetical protein